METIKGYSYGKVGQSPVSVTDLELLKKTVLFTAEDEKYLKLVGEVLKDQTNEVLDLGLVVWIISSEDRTRCSRPRHAARAHLEQILRPWRGAREHDRAVIHR